MFAHHFLGLVGLALGERFANANNRLEARRERGFGLGVHERVAFLLDGAPLGMAEDHKVHQQLAQHSSGNLAGERAVILLAHILRAEPNARFADGFRNSLQRGERRAEHHIHFRLVGEFELEAVHQFRGFGHGLFHLPVSGDD